MFRCAQQIVGAGLGAGPELGLGLAQQIGAVIVDHEEHGRLGVIGAARGSPDRFHHGRAEHFASRLRARRQVRHGDAGDAGDRNKHGLFERGQGLGLIITAPAQAAGIDLADALADTAGPAFENRLVQRVIAELIEARVCRSAAIISHRHTVLVTTMKEPADGFETAAGVCMRPRRRSAIGCRVRDGRR